MARLLRRKGFSGFFFFKCFLSGFKDQIQTNLKHLDGWVPKELKPRQNKITLSPTHVHHEQYGGYDEARVGNIAEEFPHEGW